MFQEKKPYLFLALGGWFDSFFYNFSSAEVLSIILFLSFGLHMLKWFEGLIFCDAKFQDLHPGRDTSFLKEILQSKVMEADEVYMQEVMLSETGMKGKAPGRFRFSQQHKVLQIHCFL